MINKLITITTKTEDSMSVKKTPQLNISNISKSYGRKNVLDNISFSVSAGECVGIVGINGSGKTTLFNIICGELSSFLGDVTILSDKEQSLKKNNKLLKTAIGYIPQENPLIEDLSAYDNLRLWYCDSPLNLKEELSTGVLKTLGIDEFLKVKVKHLSGGMKKRLSIGISLAANPAFLVLDEPSAALDLVAKDIIRNYLKEFKKNNGGILIATHDEDELSLCDRLLVLKNNTLSEIPPDIRGSELIKNIV